MELESCQYQNRKRQKEIETDAERQQKNNNKTHKNCVSYAMCTMTDCSNKEEKKKKHHLIFFSSNKTNKNQCDHTIKKINAS